MAAVRNKILETAKKLFLEQGYKKTTIRQIVENSGITSGSIYNLFENKDEIFAALIDEMMGESIQVVEEEFGTREPVYRYAALLSMLWIAIEKYPVFRELYYEAHVLPVLFEKIVNLGIRLENQLFGQNPIGFARKDDHRIRVLLARGAMTAYIESLEFHRPLNPEAVRKQLATYTFLSLGMKKGDLKVLLKFMESNKQVWERMADRIAG